MAVNDIIDQEERPPMVRFEKRAIEDKLASRKAGKIIYIDVDYVLVNPSYSKDIYEQKIDKWFIQVEKNVRNGRTPQDWLNHWRESYEKWKKGEEMPLNGTPIVNWSAITPAQVKNLKAINVLTIEDLAQINDEGLRRLGMGAVEMKNKARAYVQAAKDTGPLVMENAAQKKEIEILQGTVQSLTDQVKRLTNQLSSMQGQPLIEVEAPQTISAADILDEPKVEIPEQITEVPKAYNMKELRELHKEKFGSYPRGKPKEATLKAKLGL